MTSSTRTTIVNFTGSVTAVEMATSATNTNSPAALTITTLALGDNTITKPGGGSTTVALMIMPPSGNVNLITLKGIAGDTGVPLHLTDYTTIALDSTFTNLFLIAAADIFGIRFLWM